MKHAVSKQTNLELKVDINGLCNSSDFSQCLKSTNVAEALLLTKISFLALGPQQLKETLSKFGIHVCYHVMVFENVAVRRAHNRPTYVGL